MCLPRYFLLACVICYCTAAYPPMKQNQRLTSVGCRKNNEYEMRFWKFTTPHSALSRTMTPPRRTLRICYLYDVRCALYDSSSIDFSRHAKLDRTFKGNTVCQSSHREDGRGSTDGIFKNSSPEIGVQRILSKQRRLAPWQYCSFEVLFTYLLTYSSIVFVLQGYGATALRHSLLRISSPLLTDGTIHPASTRTREVR